MLFHSQEFVLLFLPVAVGAYYALARSQAAREWWLIAASLLFCGWWDVRFLLIADRIVTGLERALATGEDDLGRDWRYVGAVGEQTASP